MAYGSVAGAPISAAQTARQPELEAHADRLGESARDIHDMADSLHGIADRIFGSQPTPISKDGQGKPPYSSTLARLVDGQESIAVGRQRIREAIERLSAL